MPGVFLPTGSQEAPDAVRLTLGGQDVLVEESYEVTTSVLQQPGTFALRLGYGGVIAELAEMFPAGTEFELFVGGAKQMTGKTDGFEASGNDGTEFSIIGHDALAELHNGFIQVEKTFTAHTYKELVQFALTECGITGKLVLSDVPNRSLMTGVDVSPSPTAEQAAVAEATDTGAPGVTYRAIRTRVGDRWAHFIERNLRFAGLFLWAAADGSIILARPNPNQKPVAKLVRGRVRQENDGGDGTPNTGKGVVNVTSARWKNHTTNRFSEVLVYGRYGGKKYGRAKAKGQFDDAEMQELGYKRPLVVRDVNVSNERQAQFFASRKLAETRREGWNLEYTVDGHVAPAMGSSVPAVWSVNTVVQVDDDEYGIHGPMWVEAVTFRRPPTTTTLTLIRPQDVIFGEIE